MVRPTHPTAFVKIQTQLEIDENSGKLPRLPWQNLIFVFSFMPWSVNVRESRRKKDIKKIFKKQRKESTQHALVGPIGV